MSAFVDSLGNGDPLALLLLVAVLVIVAYIWPSALKRAKERAEIADLNRNTDTSTLESRFAVRDIHPEAIANINLADHQADVQIRLAKAQAELNGQSYDYTRQIDVKWLKVVERFKERIRERREQQRAKSRPAQAGDRQNVEADIPDAERPTGGGEPD